MRSWARRLVAVAVVAVAFAVVLPRLADYGEVRAELSELDARGWLVLAAATAANLATFGPPLMAALPGLGYARSFVVTQASTASTYLAPGGAAVGIAFLLVLLRRWSFPAKRVAQAVTLTGLWNQLAMLSFPAIALVLLTGTGGAHPLLRAVALLGLGAFAVAIAAFALLLASDRVARRLGRTTVPVARRFARLAGRGDVAWEAESVVRFRDSIAALLAHRWHVLTIATLAGQLTVFGVLAACLRVLGVEGGEVSLAEGFAAWSVVRVVGSLPVTPGGVGIVEVGLTTLLVGFGADDAEAVAAVLVYRFLTVVPTLVLGLALGPLVRRSGSE